MGGLPFLVVYGEWLGYLALAACVPLVGLALTLWMRTRAQAAAAKWRGKEAPRDEIASVEEGAAVLLRGRLRVDEGRALPDGRTAAMVTAHASAQPLSYRAPAFPLAVEERGKGLRLETDGGAVVYLPDDVVLTWGPRRSLPGRRVGRLGASWSSWLRATAGEQPVPADDVFLAVDWAEAGDEVVARGILRRVEAKGTDAGSYRASATRTELAVLDDRPVEVATAGRVRVASWSRAFVLATLLGGALLAVGLQFGLARIADRADAFEVAAVLPLARTHALARLREQDARRLEGRARYERLKAWARVLPDCDGEGTVEAEHGRFEAAATTWERCGVAETRRRAMWAHVAVGEFAAAADLLPPFDDTRPNDRGALVQVLMLAKRWQAAAELVFRVRDDSLHHPVYGGEEREEDVRRQRTCVGLALLVRAGETEARATLRETKHEVCQLLFADLLPPGEERRALLEGLLDVRGMRHGHVGRLLRAEAGGEVAAPPEAPWGYELEEMVMQRRAALRPHGLEAAVLARLDGEGERSEAEAEQRAYLQRKAGRFLMWSGDLEGALALAVEAADEAARRWPRPSTDVAAWAATRLTFDAEVVFTALLRGEVERARQRLDRWGDGGMGLVRPHLIGAPAEYEGRAFYGDLATTWESLQWLRGAWRSLDALVATVSGRMPRDGELFEGGRRSASLGGRALVRSGECLEEGARGWLAVARRDEAALWAHAREDRTPCGWLLPLAFRRIEPTSRWSWWLGAEARMPLGVVSEERMQQAAAVALAARLAGASAVAEAEEAVAGRYRRAFEAREVAVPLYLWRWR